MPLVINKNDSNKVVDRTDSLIVIPNNTGVTQALGLFTNVPSSQKNIEITRSTRRNTVLEDRNWDERNQTIAGRGRDSLLLQIPHIPADDAITPNDIDGIVSANSLREAAELESVANVRAEKMIALREAHDLTLEVARMQLITQGTAYAPNGTVVTNYYTEFGVTREEIDVDLAAITDPRAKFSEAKRAVRAGLTGGQAGTVRAFVALCGEALYNALITNPYLNETLKYVDYQGQASNLLLGKGGVDVGGLDARYEAVSVFGITFINVGAAGYENAAGDFVQFVADADAYLLPVGVRDLFKTYYAPANRFSTVNRKAQMSYWFEYMNEKDDVIEIMTEQNFLNAMLNPAAVVKMVLDI